MNNVNQDRPMRPGWNPNPRFANRSRRVVKFTVNGCESSLRMDATPSLPPGTMAWTISTPDSHVDEIAYGHSPDEPAAQLAAESACREFARALLREVGE